MKFGGEVPRGVLNRYLKSPHLSRAWLFFYGHFKNGRRRARSKKLKFGKNCRRDMYDSSKERY